MNTIMGKPYINKVTPNGTVYRDFPEGLPDLTLDDLKWNRGRRLSQEEQDALRPGEWVKYYFWLQAEVLRELKRK